MAYFTFNVGTGAQTVYPRFYFIPPYGYGDPFYDTTCNSARIAEESGDYEWIGTGNFILVGDTTWHPYNHYGKPSFNEKAKELAEAYGNEWNLSLAYNDQSLIWGGVFDLDRDYSSPHATHNIGENLDVRANGGPSSVPFDSTIRAWFVQKVEDIFGISPLHEDVGTNYAHYHIRQQ